MKTNKQDIIDRFNLLKIETIKIIDNPSYLKLENRINDNIPSYTKYCPVCQYNSAQKYCPKECFIGQDKSCLEMSWHPAKDSENKEDYKKALKFLKYIIPVLTSLPEFVFSLNYREELRNLINECDKIHNQEHVINT